MPNSQAIFNVYEISYTIVNKSKTQVGRMTTQHEGDQGIEDFLYSSNASFIEELYQAYIQDSNAVPADWREFFQGLGSANGAIQDDRPPQWIKARPDPQAVKSGGQHATQ